MIPKDLKIPCYDLEDLLGKGGMASVYRARQQSFGREVALKVFSLGSGDDASFGRRFLQESQIVAKLHHSNIVQVYDVGQEGIHYYISMEYLHGGDLTKKLAAGLSLQETVAIIKQAASALDFAHRKHIIHRDIKPENMMFREDDALVLTDFGIAKELESANNFTQTGLVIGTPRYMSPEQIRGEEVDHRADIYALGIVFFRCLTDYVPFNGKDIVVTSYLQHSEPVPALPPEVACFQPIINRMLEKDAEDRFQRGLDVVAALDGLRQDDFDGSLTNLDVAAAAKMSPPTVTRSTSGRYSTRANTPGQSVPKGRGEASANGMPLQSSAHETLVAASALIGDNLAPQPVFRALPQQVKMQMWEQSEQLMSKQAVARQSSRYPKLAWRMLILTLSGLVLWSFVSVWRQQPPQFLAVLITQGRDLLANKWSDLVNSEMLAVNSAAEEIVVQQKVEGAFEDPQVVSVGESAWQDAEGVKAVGSRADPEGSDDLMPQVFEPIEVAGPVEQKSGAELAQSESQAAAAALALDIETLLKEAEENEHQGPYSSQRNQKALNNYRQVLALAPDNAAASAGIGRIADNYLKMADRAIAQQEFSNAQSYLNEAGKVAPTLPAITQLKNTLAEAIAARQEQQLLAEATQRAALIEKLLADAAMDVAAGRVRSPEGDNALEKYQRILEIDPDNVIAIEKLVDFGR